jgi:glycosyltransferase involved in cell wall biosynthesis
VGHDEFPGQCAVIKPSPKILVVSFSPLDRDPRVRRQLFALSEQGYRVVAAGSADPGVDGVSFWSLGVAPNSLVRKIGNALLLKARLYSIYYGLMPAVRDLRDVWREHEKPGFDLIISNDIDSLPVALELAGNAPVFFDAHEFSPGEWGSWSFNFVFQRYKRWQCEKYLTKPKAMSTVCAGIAEAYSRNFGIDTPMVIMNAPNYLDIRPTIVDPAHIKLVHHGAAQAHRRLEIMIDMMSLLDDRFTLDFYLMTEFRGGPDYLEQLRKRADALGVGDRVLFLDPVPTEDIAKVINQYDIGVYPLRPSCVNEELALPNKFFEFIQARLAVAIGPSTEMARLLQRYDLGVVADDFSAEAMARSISELSAADIRRYKENADAAAKGLSFDAQAPLFLRTVQGLLDSG